MQKRIVANAADSVGTGAFLGCSAFDVADAVDVRMAALRFATLTR